LSKPKNAVEAVDPTRFFMVEGGGANKDNSLPVHADHYIWYNDNVTLYPALAYGPNPAGGGRGRWVWDQKRPRFNAEDYYINGFHPAFSYFAGDEAFLGQQSTRRGATIAGKMLAEGYRWSHFGAFQLFAGPNNWTDAIYNSFSPRAVFTRQWDWTFGSGQKVKRTFGIFNDTYTNDPLTFTRVLVINGKTVWTKTTTHNVAAGTDQKFR
jgi:beta-galactosidase